MALDFEVIKKIEPKYHHGLTNKQHLGWLYGNNPVAAKKFATELFQRSTNTIDLFDFLDMYPTKTFDREDMFYWDVTVKSERNYVLKECRINGTPLAATDKAGIARSVFQLVFTEPWLYKTDVTFGDHKEYQMRVISNAENINDDYIYDVVFISTNDDDYIPYSELQPGKRFSRIAGGVEYTMSSEGSKFGISSPFRLMNAITTIRMEETVPGGMEREIMGMVIREGNKSFILWQNYREYLFDLEFRKQRAYNLYYSRLNLDSEGKAREFGSSGYAIYQGAGLRQQLEGSGVETYPTDHFDINWLTDVLVDTSVNKLPFDKRKFLMKTGERGMIQFSKSLQDYASLYTPLNDSSRVVMKGGNILQYRGQFLEFMGPNGVEVTLALDPFKDDPVHNKIMHPNGGTAESYVYDIMDIGTSNGEPNIFKVAIKGYEDVRGYEAGFGSPWNLKGNEMVSNPVHAWKEYRMWKGGIIVSDPTRCKILKPQILV